MVRFYDLLERRRMDDVTIFVEQLDSMLLCVCTVKDYRGL